MAQPKASTLQSRFGFLDNDLKSPDHDQIMMWLDANVETIVKLITKYDGNWENEKLNYLKNDIERIGKPPAKPPLEIKKIWEHAITGKNGFMIGFVDMVVEVYEPYLRTFRDEWEITSYNNPFFFEVKSVLPTLGELIRQVRMYQEYTYKAKFYIVAPDDKYAQQLNQQGIGFIKYPDGTIFDTV